jgi:hypothetical protein
MPIDPTIALNIKPVQLANPLEQFGQYQQAQAAMSQNRLADLVFGEKQREVTDAAQMNMLYKGAMGLDGKLDRNKLLGDAAAGGLGSHIPGLQKSFLDLDQSQAKIAETQANTTKANATAAKDSYDTLLKQTSAISEALGSLRGMPGVTPQYVASTLQHLGDVGIIPTEHLASSLAQIPQDPAQLPAWLKQKQWATMSTLDQMKFTEPDANTVATNATSRANNAATVAATIRGQNLTDARAREQLAQGKVPSGYRANPDGTLVPITGGPADQSNKAPTEFQGKSAAFGARAEQANRILTDLEGQYSPAGINGKNAVSDIWGVGGALGNAWNSNLSDASQRADQAQRDFVNAVLRQESGAAIGAGEFDNAKKQYFPQPGDSAAVLKQKAANRQLAVQGLKSNAGHAAFSAPQASAPAQPSLPATNGKGWALHVDAGGNRAYVSPDGQQYEEVH